MKRLLAPLVLFLLLPVCATAFDLSPYEIESISGTIAAPVPDGITPDILEGQPDNLIGTGGGYISFRETEGQPAGFQLYDVDLRLIAQGVLPSEYAHLSSLYDDGDAVLLSLILPTKPSAQFLAARIGKDGQLLWKHMADYAHMTAATIALPDGSGGAWLSAQVVDPDNYDDYAGTKLTHINAQGEVGFSRILKTGKEILLVRRAVSHPENGSVTLFCSLVAKSKGVYTALAVTIDPDGSIPDTQARDFSMRGDTDFDFRIAKDGSMWVFSDQGMHYGGKGVLVPFDALPALTPPVLTFQ